MPSRRLVLFLATAVLPLFIAVYVWSEFRAVTSLGEAVRNRDRDALSALVDFPAVRESLKSQIGAQLAQRAAGNKPVKNPLIALVLTVLPTIVNPLVDAVVTPDGIIALLSQPMGDHASSVGHSKTKWTHSWRFVDLNHFRTEYREANDPKIVFGLVFERQGPFTWKVVRLDVPADELAKRLGKSDENDSTDVVQDHGDANEALPTKVGDCAITSVKRVTTRLQDSDGTPVPGSGSAIGYTNGGAQVSYDMIGGIEHAKEGDLVRLCLTSIPQHCPPGDDRGRVYTATDLRTHEEWTAPDSEHACGGA